MKERRVLLSFLLILFISPGFSDEKVIYSIGGAVKPPKIIRAPLAPYTEEARKNQVEGTVLLEAVITAEGKVTETRVLKGLGYGMDESALKTLTTRWAFEPATYHGQPVAVRTNFELRFHLLGKMSPVRAD